MRSCLTVAGISSGPTPRKDLGTRLHRYDCFACCRSSSPGKFRLPGLHHLCKMLWPHKINFRLSTGKHGDMNKQFQFWSSSSSDTSDHLQWLKCPAILIMQILLIESFKFKFYAVLVLKSATDVLMCLVYFPSLSRSADLNCSIFEDYEGGNQIYRWLASVALQC